MGPISAQGLRQNEIEKYRSYRKRVSGSEKTPRGKPESPFDEEKDSGS